MKVTDAVIKLAAAANVSAQISALVKGAQAEGRTDMTEDEEATINSIVSALAPTPTPTVAEALAVIKAALGV